MLSWSSTEQQLPPTPIKITRATTARKGERSGTRKEAPANNLDHPHPSRQLLGPQEPELLNPLFLSLSGLVDQR
jgi:hypothetical protein